MKRFIPILFALLIPAALFAQQGRAGDEGALLKGFGLSESQIAQADAIEKSTRETVRADMTHIRLIQAQIEEALLPAAPDAQAINAMIDKKAQLRADSEKALMSARLQLMKIMGEENFALYAKRAMREMGPMANMAGPFGPDQRPRDRPMSEGQFPERP